MFAKFISRLAITLSIAISSFMALMVRKGDAAIDEAFWMTGFGLLIIWTVVWILSAFSSEEF